MKNSLKIGFLICLLAFPLFSQITSEVALQIVMDDIVDNDIYDVDVYQLEETIYLNDEIEIANGEELICLYDESYIFFIDDYIYANWGHPCRYVFVSTEDGEYYIVDEVIFPLDYSDYDCVSEATRIVALSKNNVQNTQLQIPSENGSRYAVLISGAFDYNTNAVRFWNNVSAFYCTLREKYGIPKNKIFVHIDDGVGGDCYGFTYQDPDDLDGGAPSDDIDFDATYNSIEHTFKALGGDIQDNNIPELTQNDELIIFTVGHGGGQYSTNNFESEIYTWYDGVYVFKVNWTSFIVS